MPNIALTLSNLKFLIMISYSCFLHNMKLLPPEVISYARVVSTKFRE